MVQHSAFRSCTIELLFGLAESGTFGCNEFMASHCVGTGRPLLPLSVFLSCMLSLLLQLLQHAYTLQHTARYAASST